jgi:signal transduction histidine kinase
MVRLDRLHLVGEMAASFGHEIRNPMTSVRGLLQVLGGKPECLQYKDYLDLMIGELDRANSIIEEFLSLAKDRAVIFKIQNLNSILEAVSPLILAGALIQKKYADIELGDIPDLPFDEKEIRQVILNLVRNGLEAMTPGGCLTIRTFAEENEVVLSAQDQGDGIAPDIIEKIGNPFFTTKEQGTGLGLAVCYSIAARHGATIKIETGSRGSTFSFRFPYPDNAKQ